MSHDSHFIAMNEYGFIPLRFLVLLTVLQPENITCVVLISHWGYAAVGVYMLVCVCSLASLWTAGGSASICDEEVSSWLGPHGAVQAAAPWSIIYYRTSLLLLCVNNALHRDDVPEVNAARLTPVPSDKRCQWSIPKSSPSVKYHAGQSIPAVAEGVSPQVQEYVSMLTADTVSTQMMKDLKSTSQQENVWYHFTTSRYIKS